VPLFAILTLFPDALAPYLSESILGSARERGLVEVLLVDFRDFARDRHRTVDDRPFGGGPGMVLKPEPIADCVEWLEARYGAFRRFALCPGGRPFRQELAVELARDMSTPERARTLLLAGRYEGFDERLREELAFEDLSLGDFVLSGGELAALAVVEAVTRLLPGALGDDRSALQDSFSDPSLLDCPHFTRPRVWRGREVPPVLLSGDHQRIEAWRKEQARGRTRARRPDLGAGPAAPPPVPPRSPERAPYKLPSEPPLAAERYTAFANATPTPSNQPRPPQDEPRPAHEPCT
jgi:tRNA (guanine37-N1)-methyltransferase